MENSRPPDPIKSFVASVALAALTGVGAWIAIPIGPVPISLQVLFVYLAALLLRPRYAGLAMLLYVAMGLVGIPVFAAGGAGLAVLLGPTGGYLVGFILGAVLASAIQGGLSRIEVRARFLRLGMSVLPLVVCAAVIFGLGATWAKFQTGLDWQVILLGWVVPFLPGDGFKIVAAAIIADEVQRRRLVTLR